MLSFELSVVVLADEALLLNGRQELTRLLAPSVAPSVALSVVLSERERRAPHQHAPQPQDAGNG